MSVLRPFNLGGTIAVSDSAALAAMNIDGLPPGTKVFNADVGHYFRLATCVQREIALDPADTYASGVFSLANGAFTSDDDGNTLVFQLDPPNASLSGVYSIDTVDSATDVEVTPAPAFTQTLPLVGNLILIENALETDVTVSALGTIESVWRLDTSDADVQSVTGDGIDNADPHNPVFGLLDAIADATAPAVAAALDMTFGPAPLASASDTINVTGLDGDKQKAYAVRGAIKFAAGPTSVKVQPQGADTSCASQAGDFALGNIVSNSVMNLGANNATAAIYSAGDTLVIQGFINAASGNGYRQFNFEMMHLDNSDAILGRVFMIGTYKDSATKLTSVKFLASAAARFDVGSAVKFTAIGA